MAFFIGLIFVIRMIRWWLVGTANLYCTHIHGYGMSTICMGLHDVCVCARVRTLSDSAIKSVISRSINIDIQIPINLSSKVLRCLYIYGPMPNGVFRDIECWFFFIFRLRVGALKYQYFVVC